MGNTPSIRDITGALNQKTARFLMDREHHQEATFEAHTRTAQIVLDNQKMSDSLVSIIIPAFNEEKNLGAVLKKLKTFTESFPVKCEVIVVDDGSTDKTKEIAYQNGVFVLSYNKNQGKGFALQRGLQFSSGNIIVTMDADGSHDPADIANLVWPVIKGVDVVIGSRFLTAVGKYTTSRVNMIGNYLINLSVLMMTGRQITDSQSGFRAFKSEVLKEIGARAIQSKGFAFETEAIVKVMRDGYKVEEVPLNINKRMNGVSHVSPFKDGLRIFKVIIESAIRIESS